VVYQRNIISLPLNFAFKAVKDGNKMRMQQIIAHFIIQYHADAVCAVRFQRSGQRVRLITDLAGAFHDPLPRFVTDVRVII
jgi:hypothetical protein